MKFELTTPCDNCPFRTDIEPYLTVGRVSEIADALVEGNATFSCHKLNDYDDETDEAIEGERSQHCAGALIMLEHMGRSTQMMRIAERLGMYDHRKLSMDAPVFREASDMVNACIERNGSRGKKAEKPSRGRQASRTS